MWNLYLKTIPIIIVVSKTKNKKEILTSKSKKVFPSALHQKSYNARERNQREFH